MMDEAELCNHEETAVTDNRKAYEAMFDAQMKEWNAQIVLLKAKADITGAEARIECYKTIKALRYKRDTAKAKLRQLKCADHGALESLKKEAEKAWSVVRRPFTLRSQDFNEPCRLDIEANLTAMNRRGWKQ